MRRLRSRGFDDEAGRHLLRDRGEIGQSLAGNALRQVLPDVAGVQVLLLLSEVQEDNWTSFKRWKARSVRGHPGAAQGAAQRTVSGMQEVWDKPNTDGVS